MLGIIVLLSAAIAGWLLTREELASGSGKQGGWRVVASWGPGGYCVKRLGRRGEGGACGLAAPGTIDQSISWRVFRDRKPYTLVAGPAPPEAQRVVVEPEHGRKIESSGLTTILRMRFYVVEVPDVQRIEAITAVDARGRVVDRLDHAPLPPPPH